MGGQDRSAGTTGNKERTDGVKSQKSLANIRSGKSAKPSRPTLRAEQVCESWEEGNLWSTFRNAFRKHIRGSPWKVGVRSLNWRKQGAQIWHRTPLNKVTAQDRAHGYTFRDKHCSQRTKIRNLDRVPSFSCWYSSLGKFKCFKCK